MIRPEPLEILDTTESVCPICLKVVKARIVAADGKVVMKKTCPDHGPNTVCLWPDVQHYQWMQSLRLPFVQPELLIQTMVDKGCPEDCGLCSVHLRHPTLVEIEVTQRCNLHCPVCFMSAGDAPPDPSLETLESMYRDILFQAGMQMSVQITGGEPTLRADLPDIIRLGSGMGFEAIEINTNGLVIAQDPEYLRTLQQAGISGIYLQFDGLTPEVYLQIRGKDILAEKLQVIETCRQLGVQVVLAMTIIEGINQNQVGPVLDFALANIDIVRGLALQPAFTSGRFEARNTRRLTMGDVIFMLAEQSAGRIRVEDLWPLNCSHPLCSCATQLIISGGEVLPFTRLISLDEYKAKFNPHSPQGSIFADILAGKNIHYDHSLAVVVMNYMDAGTLDLKRLKECSMAVTMKDGRLIPFCIYQLSGFNGQRLYPAWGEIEPGEAEDG